jgi:hypothetical protein
MDYEIYNTATGRRVNIGDESYPLEVFSGEPNSFTVAAPYNGARNANPVLDAWLQAAAEVGVPLRYAWHGVMNSLGHHGSETPPWTPKERDYRRDDHAPIMARDWKVWVEWQPGQWAVYEIRNHMYDIFGEKHHSLACFNKDGLCFNGYETYGHKRIASNVPALASDVLSCKDIEYAASLEALDGQEMPCPIYTKV